MKCLATILGVVGMLSCVMGNSYAQTFTIASGKWSSPSIWNNGIVPDFTHGPILINHAVVIPQDTTLTVDQLTVNAPLTIESNATVTIAYSGFVADLDVLAGSLNVFGKLICNDNAVALTSTTTAIFHDGSCYEHRYYSIAGEPPTATWQPNSTLLITGFTSSKSLSTIGWQQNFGHVVYNCPGQLSFIDMLGNVKNVGGDFKILNTNGNILRLSLDKVEQTVINIGGDFIIEGNSEVWISRGGNTKLNVLGDMEFKSTSAAASYITTQGNSELNVNGNVSMNAAGAFRFASSGGGTGMFRVAGNLLMTSGKLDVETPGIGSLEFIGSTKQTIMFYDDVPATLSLINSNSVEVEVQSADDILGNIQSNSGYLILPENFALYGNLVLEAMASLKIPEVFKIIGSTDQQLDVNGEVFDNVSINKPDGTTVTLSSSFQLRHALTIQSTNTDLVSDGHLTLLSQSDDGTMDASISELPSGSGITGAVHVQRHMTGEGRIYRYISSPVTNATVADLQNEFAITGTFDNPSTGPGIKSNSPSFFFYDESVVADGGWTSFPKTGLSQEAFLIPGLGYAAYIRNSSSATVWDVTGIINQGEISLPVQYHNYNDPDNDGWNLVGNPYPATIDWDAAGGWERINIKTGFYIRDNGVGQFLFWDGAIGNLGSGRIAKGQSFWIKTEGDNPLLKVNENAKVNGSAAFYRKDSEALDFLEFTLTSSYHQDKTYFRLLPSAQPGYDNHDMIKLNNDHLNISVQQNGLSMAIAAADVVDCHEPLTLRIFSGADKPMEKGDYQLQCNVKGIFELHALELVDNYTQQHVMWQSDAAYKFVVNDDTASYNVNRFQIRILDTHPAKNFHIQYDSVYCEEGIYAVTLSNLSRGWNIDLQAEAMPVTSTKSTGEVEQILNIHHPTTINDSLQISLLLKNACGVQPYSWEVKQFELPVVTEEYGILVSSTHGEHQWYANENLLVGETSHKFKPIASGTYGVYIQQNHCSANVYYDFIFQFSQPKIFPNPARVEVNCLAPFDERLTGYQIFNCLGKKVKASKFSADQKLATINIADLDVGIYLLELKSNAKLYTVTLIKGD